MKILIIHCNIRKLPTFQFIFYPSNTVKLAIRNKVIGETPLGCIDTNLIQNRNYEMNMVVVERRSFFGIPNRDYKAEIAYCQLYP